MHCKNQPYILLYVYVYFFALCIFLKEILTTYNTYVCKIYNYNPQSRVRNSENETFQWFSSKVWGSSKHQKLVRGFLLMRQTFLKFMY